jgi:hypothetical protein
MFIEYYNRTQNFLLFPLNELTVNVYNTILTVDNFSVIKINRCKCFLYLTYILNFINIETELFSNNFIEFLKIKTDDIIPIPYIKYTEMSNDDLKTIIIQLENYYYNFLINNSFQISILLFSDSNLYDIATDIIGNIVINGIIYSSNTKFIIDMLIEVYFKLYENITNTYSS